MLTHDARRVARRLFTLLILVAALAAATYGPAQRTALAAPCEECEANYNACVTSCGDPAPSACLFFCQNRYNRCLSTCT
jgi:hypothetical protein